MSGLSFRLCLFLSAFLHALATLALLGADALAGKRDSLILDARPGEGSRLHQLTVNYSGPAAPFAATPSERSLPTDPDQSVQGGDPGLESVTGELLRAIEYPDLARQMQLEGEVHVRMTVGPDGHVSEARVEQSSGHRVLDNAAREGVAAWNFDRRFAGRVLVVPVRFRLRQSY